MPDVDQAPAIAGQPLVGRGARGPAQDRAAFTGGQAEPQVHVGQRVHVKVVVFRRQLDPPAT